MDLDENEEKLLRAVALQNARSILLAQERAERELLQAKDALEHKTEELTQEREWFKVTLSSIGDAVITTDTEGRITFLNPVAEVMTGWQANEAIGQPLQNVFKIISEQSRQPAHNPIQRALEDGAVVGLANHTALISRNGKETAIADSAAPIRDASGKISGAVMVFHDVTERRRAEEALQKSENRKAAILNAALDAIITMDHEGKVVDFNPAAEKIFCHNHKDVVGKLLSDLIIPERFRKRHLEGMALYLAGGPGPILGKRIEMPALRADGREFPTELSISPIAGMEPPMFTATLRDITQRKKDEQALRESEQKLRATFDQAAVGIAIAQLDGRFEQVNQRFADILGYSRAELCSRTFIGLTHPDDLAATGENVRQMLAGEISSYVMEKRYVRKDGGAVSSRTTVTFLKDTVGRPERFIGVIEEITERKRAEEALRQSAEFNRTIIENSRDCIKTLSLEGVLLWISETGRKSLCIEHVGQVLGKSWIEFWDREEQPAARAAVQSAAQGGTGNFSGCCNMDHQPRWWDVVITPILDSAGRPEKLLAVSRDVTERKQTEEVRVRLAAVVETSDDAILSMSLDTVITTWNQGAERMFGYTAEEIVGKSVTILIPPDRVDEEPAILERLRRGERVEHYETLRVRKDGVALNVSLTVSPIANANGTIIGVSKILRDITQRKQAEESLRRSEEDLRALANSIPQLTWMAQPDGEIFWYNHGWFDYTGTTMEEMRGWGWQKVHDPQILPQVVERWQLSLNTAQPFEMEFPLRGADGVFRWFLTRVNPVRNREGQVVRWFGTNTNVDEVRRAKEALQDETRILELLNNTGTAIASQLDLQTIVQTVTDAATELSGAKFGAFFYNVINQQGESFLLYTLSGAPREAFEKFGLPRNTPVFNPTFKGEGVIRSADITKDPRYGTMSPHRGMPKGHLPVCSYLAVPVISRSGEVIGGLFFGHPEPNVFTERSERLVVGVAAQAAIAIDNARLYEAAQKEIAERKTAEIALRESEQRFRTVADAAPVLIWLAGTDKLCNYLNKAWLEFVGHPMEQELGNGWTNNIHPEELERCLQTYGNAFVRRQPFEMEYRIRHHTGAYRWILDRGVPRFGPDGTFQGYIGGCVDIDDQKRAEEKLEKVVAERTVALRETIGELEAFSYSISHDMRAPLRAMQSFALILEEECAPQISAEGKQYIRRIVTAAERMDRLIQDVLTYSRVARVDMPLERVDVEKLIRDILDLYPMFRPPAAAINLEAPLPPVLGAESVLTQCISNLLGNAIKFVAPGVKAHVHVWAETKGKKVRLFFKDNGLGIPQEAHERIFEIFQRVSKSYEGTGIGLAIVRKGVERMGGSVGLQSEPGKGSTFWLELTAAE
jgi:PAS domain S-box-containing protein